MYSIDPSNALRISVRSAEQIPDLCRKRSIEEFCKGSEKVYAYLATYDNPHVVYIVLAKDSGDAERYLLKPLMEFHESYITAFNRLKLKYNLI